jgi:membrane protein DedA with SNARE-associated domain
MLDQLEHFILNSLQTLFDQFGWAGVFAVMVLENATGLTPSEIILTLAGWMLLSAHDLPPALILFGGFVAALGSTVGSTLAYWFARLGGRPLIDRALRLFRLDPALVNLAENQFQRWGPGLVLIGRVIPGVRTLVSLPAGLARMPFPAFFAATLAGTYIWCTLLIGAGYLLGHEWRLISGYLKQYLPFLLAGGFGALGLYVFWRYRRALAPAPVEVE